jgi:hypothetical protein
VVLPPAGALSADYWVYPNGTAYCASVDITDASRYEFSAVGILGENVPITVSNVELSGNCSPCEYNWSRSWGTPPVITFPKGNYTISYMAPLGDNHLQANFGRQYHVNVTIPSTFDVRNPLLATISPGANVIRYPDNTTQVSWNKTAAFDLRFYDQGRESLLYMFGNFLIIIAIVLLLPFFMMRKKHD